MEQNSGEIRSGEAMSIFGQSIDVRRSGRSRRTRRATHKVPSDQISEKEMMCCLFLFFDLMSFLLPISTALCCI